jgi:hypothetical protein
MMELMGRVGGGTFMSSATLEPSTEYTLAAPAMRAKKDSMPRMLQLLA